MKTTNKITSLALAAAAATLIATAPMTDSAGEGVVGKCMGVNACKGKSDRKTANSACAGQYACKGKGFMELDKVTCNQVGGEFNGVYTNDRVCAQSTSADAFAFPSAYA